MAAVTIYSDLFPQTYIYVWGNIKSVTVSIVSPSICHEVMGLDAMTLVFWMLSFKATFFTLLFHFNQEALYFFFGTSLFFHVQF